MRRSGVKTGPAIGGVLHRAFCARRASSRELFAVGVPCLPLSSLRAEQGADELSAAPHADLVEHCLEMVLDGVGANPRSTDWLGVR